MSRITAVVVTLFAVVTFLTVALVPTPSGAAPLYATPTPIATGTGVQDAPAQGQYDWPIVWETYDTDWHVVLASPTELYPLSAAAGVQRHPAVQGNQLVYEDDRNGTWDLYTTQVALPYSPALTQVDAAFATGPGDQVNPAVDRGTVVYQDNEAGNWDIYARSLSTGVDQRLTSDPADQVDPAIAGDIVVFADHRNGNWDVYSFDLTTGKTARLTTNGAAQQAPKIRQGVVVYQDHRNGNWDIYAYAVKTGKERRLTTDPHDQTAPSIGAGRTVAYEDDRAGASDVFLFDLASGRNFPVTDDPAPQTQPTVAEDFVAWTDTRGGDEDIYGTALDYPRLMLDQPGGTPAYGSSVVIRGDLQFANDGPATASIHLKGTGVPATVPVEWPAGGGPGTFACKLRVVRKVMVTAVYRGDAGHLPSVARSVVILPTAGLSTPAVKRVQPDPQKWSHSLHASGTLRPLHKAGTKAVTLQVWRRPLNGEWSLYRSFKVPLRTVNGVSTYSAKVLATLGAIGDQFKVRAIHADADHAKTTSAFSKVVAGP